MDTLSLSVNAVSYTVAAELPTTDDPFNGPIKDIAPWNFTILAVLMFVVTSLSLSENFLVMFVTFKFKQLRQPLNYIIVNLAIADFLVSLTGGVISFLTNARGYFFLGKWACVLEGFAVTFFGIVALWSLAVLSFERFFVICRPLGNIRLQAKHAVLGLLFVWTFSFIWTFPPVLGWNRYTVSKIGTTCEPDWYSTSMKAHSYIITFFTTCFILPLGVIFFCYGKLLRKLRKVSHGRLANARKPERQVTRMVVVMIVAFMVGWTPYAVFSILVTAHPTIELDPRLASIPAFFSKTAAVYNPIIYVFMNKQFRKCLIQLFTGMGTIPDSNLNQTSERPGITAESQTGEMSAIAARIPVGGTASPRKKREKKILYLSGVEQETWQTGGGTWEAEQEDDSGKDESPPEAEQTGARDDAVDAFLVDDKAQHKRSFSASGMKPCLADDGELLMCQRGHHSQSS